MPATTYRDVDGLHSNHPGSLYFQFVAIPFALSGYSFAGLLVGGLLVSAALLVGSLWAAHSVAGRLGVIITAIYFALLEYELAGRLLTGWNPHVSSLALVASMIFAWAILEKRREFLPGFIVASALAAQSHIAAVPSVLVFSCVVAVSLYRQRSSTPRLGRWLRYGSIAAFVISWWAPITDTVFRDPGNLQTLVTWTFSRSGDSSSDMTGAILNTIKWGAVALLLRSQRKREHWGSLFYLGALAASVIALLALLLPTRLGYLDYLLGTAYVGLLALASRFTFLQRHTYVPVLAALVFWAALVVVPPLPKDEAASSKLAAHVSDSAVELLKANPNDQGLPLVVDGVGGFAWMSLASSVQTATISHVQPATLRNFVIDQDQVWRRPALNQKPRRELLLREIGPRKDPWPLPEGSRLIARTEVWPEEQVLIDLGDVREEMTDGFELVLIEFD